MISAGADTELKEAQAKRFSAIARSVMISAATSGKLKIFVKRFSAIARSVMISASIVETKAVAAAICFSAIARSVMISARTNLKRY